MNKCVRTNYKQTQTFMSCDVMFRTKSTKRDSQKEKHFKGWMSHKLSNPKVIYWKLSLTWTWPWATVIRPTSSSWKLDFILNWVPALAQPAISPWVEEDIKPGNEPGNEMKAYVMTFPNLFISRNEKKSLLKSSLAIYDYELGNS